MSRKYVAGPDNDLDVEIVQDKNGQQITERRAQAIASEALAKAGVGRPSLTGAGTHSPEIKAEYLRSSVIAWPLLPGTAG